MLIELIKRTLGPAKLKPQYLNLLLSRMDLYQVAFTSSSYDAINNYEIYELLGDSTYNKFLVWYFYRRFPQFNCISGVKMLARLKINYASKRTLAQIADRLGFWQYILASDDQKSKGKKSLLEDVFEAFLGLTELIIDEQFVVGVGFVVVNDILTSIFDDMSISLEYEDLFDAKTRLKELFDSNTQLGKLLYENIGGSSVIFRITSDGKKIQLGEGGGFLKADREQNASKMALEELRRQGVIQKVNYNLICE